MILHGGYLGVRRRLSAGEQIMDFFKQVIADSQSGGVSMLTHKGRRLLRFFLLQKRDRSVGKGGQRSVDRDSLPLVRDKKSARLGFDLGVKGRVKRGGDSGEDHDQLLPVESEIVRGTEH